MTRLSSQPSRFDQPADLRITALPPRTSLRADLPTMLGTLLLVGLMLLQLV